MVSTIQSGTWYTAPSGLSYVATNGTVKTNQGILQVVPAKTDLMTPSHNNSVSSQSPANVSTDSVGNALGGTYTGGNYLDFGNNPLPLGVSYTPINQIIPNGGIVITGNNTAIPNNVLPPSLINPSTSSIGNITPAQQQQEMQNGLNQFVANQPQPQTSLWDSLFGGNTGTGNNTLLWVVAGIAGVLFLTTIVKR
jgi:hypothetical protein